MTKNTYEAFGLNMTKGQLEKVLKAAKAGKSVKIRLKKNNLNGDQLIPLTKTQINRIKESKTGLDLTFSVAQLKHCKKLGEKSGGLLPLLALLPLLFGGLGAAGGLAGGISSAVASAKASKANEAQLAESIRHNKEIESQLSKSGSGYLSQLASKVPVFGQVLKHALEKLGFGFYLDPKGRGLFLDPQGAGFYLDPQGNGYFLDPIPK